jgi:23S rRNA pseudouridine1911/1915/1917 synthase
VPGDETAMAKDAAKRTVLDRDARMTRIPMILPHRPRSFKSWFDSDLAGMTSTADSRVMEIRVDQPADRLDAFLASALPELSRSRIQTLIREQFITVDDHAAKPRDTVKPGQTIRVMLPESVPEEPQPQDIPLQILHEDDEIVVVDKAAGLVVHPAPGNPDGTLVNALLHHCNGRLSTLGGVSRPGIVHRLDKDTSGCLVAAKTDRAHESLTAQFAQRSTMEKIYLAVTKPAPKPSHQTVFTHIARHPGNRQKMAVVDPPNGKPAITDYEVLWIDAASSTALVLCRLHTGRTHQIRVHLRHQGAPLVGDPIYGKPMADPSLPTRLMLHAWKLSFEHPVSGSRMTFESPAPIEFRPWLIPAGLDHAMR